MQIVLNIIKVIILKKVIFNLEIKKFSLILIV